MLRRHLRSAETMTTKPFDKFNKSLFQELLSPFGQVIPNMAVLGSERMIDVFFAPHPGISPDFDELGDLAQMTTKPALLEPFRSALTDEDVQICLMKLFMFNADQKREHPGVSVEEPPTLWLLAAEVSDRLLVAFGGVIDPVLGEGFYRLVTGLQTIVVAIDELPRVPESLWLRLMGKGRTQEDAIEELLLLPESDPKRSSAIGLLVAWRISISVVEQVESEEQQILMALSQTYLEWEKETERRGSERGLRQERQSAIMNLMRFRFGSIDTTLEALIPSIMELSSEEYTRLLLQLSKEELIQQFDL
jgi:hypothetical protein